MGPQQANYGYYGEPKKGINKKFIAMIGGALVVVIILVAVLASFASQNSIGTQSQHLSARLNNLSDLTTSSAKQLRNRDMQKINAETALLTAGAQADLVTILPEKPDKSIITAESAATDTATLANAALTNTYDSEYKTIMTRRLESVTALLTEMYEKTGSKTTRALINTDYKNFSAILENLQKVTL